MLSGYYCNRKMLNTSSSQSLEKTKKLRYKRRWREITACLFCSLPSAIPLIWRSKTTSQWRFKLFSWILDCWSSGTCDINHVLVANWMSKTLYMQTNCLYLVICGDNGSQYDNIVALNLYNLLSISILIQWRMSRFFGNNKGTNFIDVNQNLAYFTPPSPCQLFSTFVTRI